MSEGEMHPFIEPGNQAESVTSQEASQHAPEKEAIAGSSHSQEFLAQLTGLPQGQVEVLVDPFHKLIVEAATNLYQPWEGITQDENRTAASIDLNVARQYYVDNTTRAQLARANNNVSAQTIQNRLNRTNARIYNLLKGKPALGMMREDVPSLVDFQKLVATRGSQQEEVVQGVRDYLQSKNLL